MWPNPQFHADLVTFTKEILNGKTYFLCNEWPQLVFKVPLKKNSLWKQVFKKHLTLILLAMCRKDLFSDRFAS